MSRGPQLRNGGLNRASAATEQSPPGAGAASMTPAVGKTARLTAPRIIDRANQRLPFTTSVLVLRSSRSHPPCRLRATRESIGETQEWPAGPRPTTRWSQTGARYPSRRGGRLDVRARARLTTAMATNKPAPTADRTTLSPGLKRGQRAASPICGSELVPAAPHAARERLVVRRCICVAARPERASSGHQRRRLLRAPKRGSRPRAGQCARSRALLQGPA